MSQRMQQGGVPMIVMDEEAQRVSDRDAQEYNVSAARAVAEAVRSTLGPKGMDKMLVDSMGDVTVTNDGVTILQEMDIDNPTAEMVIEVAETQEDEAGDGTTTAVAVAGELLKNAEDLLERDVHPTTAIKGFSLASDHARGAVGRFVRPFKFGRAGRRGDDPSRGNSPHESGGSGNRAPQRPVSFYRRRRGRARGSSSFI